MTMKLYLACASVLGISAGLSNAAWAQSANDKGEVVEEVIVTATKRSTTIQTTPLSISAVNGENLQKQGATGLADYFRTVPGVNLTQGTLGQTRVSIRGIRGVGEATVGLYYDETSVTGPSGTTQDPGNNAADLNLFDVERIEVLRGPQGTLYGGSSMGGALRVIFNKPDSTQFGASIEAQASATKGGSGAGFLKAMGNIPLVEGKLAARIVAFTEERPGFIDNVTLGTKNINDSRSSGYRGMLGFTPTEDITIVATSIHQSSHADDMQGYYLGLGRNKISAITKLPFQSKMDLQNLTAKWSTPVGDLTATSSYYEYGVLRSTDFTPQYKAYVGNAFGVIGYQPAELTAWNHEVRLSSKDKGPLQWTVGLYSELRKDHIVSNTIETIAATGEPYAPFRYIQARYIDTNVEQTAQFGELTYSPDQVPGLALTAGARHYAYTKTTAGAGLQPNLFTGAAPAPYSSRTAKASGWVYKFNASYKLSPDAMIYAGASEGFRPGGANNIPTLDSRLVVYEPDSLWNYETGVKTAWFGGRLVANAAVYRVDWKNMQAIAQTSDGLYAFLYNSGGGRLIGGELELTARPVRGLTLTGTLAHVEGKTTGSTAVADLLVPGSSGNKGDKISFAPDWTASASASYTWPLRTGLDGMVRADAAYTGETWAYKPDFIYYTKWGSFTTLNLRAGVEGQGWGLYAFANNVTDAAGVMNSTSGYGYSQLAFGLAPRTVGLNARRSF